MVKLRLARFGAKKSPFYRIVATDIHNKRDGQYIELLGTYNPMMDPPEVKLVADRIRYWMSVGAQPSDRVKVLLNSNLDKAVS